MAVARLRELRTQGVGHNDCVRVLSDEFAVPLTYPQVEQAAKRYGISHLLELDSRPERFVVPTLPMDDYAIFSDVHSPFHSELWVNRLLRMSEKFGVKKAIAVGDLLDCQFASKWYSDTPKTLDAEADLVRPMFDGLNWFDYIWWCRGNHENRVGLLTDGKIQMKHLGRMLGGDVWDKITYSRYDKFFIGDSWMLVHPKSYRPTVVSLARDLAAKFIRNVINTHGHFVGMGFDKSGRFLCVDLGGLFDPAKVDYVNLSTTAHPAWGNGFGILVGGKFWHFTENTDWGYWLGDKT